jgi:hypothetical protein
MALPFTESAESSAATSSPPSWETAGSLVIRDGAAADTLKELTEGERTELGQHLAWETHILGLPVSALADPLALVAHRLPEHVPLHRLVEMSARSVVSGQRSASPEQPGRPITVAGVRLPGWTGGQGFFLSDGGTFVIAKPPKSLRTPQPWRPLIIRGRWLGDSWGNFWLQVDQLNEIT